MSDLTVRPDGPQGQPDNVTPDDWRCGDSGLHERHRWTTPLGAEFDCDGGMTTVRAEVAARGAGPDWSRFEACPACWAPAGAPCQMLGGYMPRDPHPDRQLKLAAPAYATTPDGGMTPETVSWVSRPDGSGLHRAGETAAEMTDDEANEEFDGLPVSLLAEPQRTVSLELITREVREAEPAMPDADPLKTTWIPEHARVAIVLRAGGVFVAVTETDADWLRNHKPVALLSRMLQQAGYYAADGGAELLMPTPDVLAALDGRPDAQLLTAPVWVLAMDVTPGMLLRPESAAPQRLVTETPKCTDPECAYDPCAVFVVAELPDGELHQSGYARTRVRIPVSVTL